MATCWSALVQLVLEVDVEVDVEVGVVVVVVVPEAGWPVDPPEPLAAVPPVEGGEVVVVVVVGVVLLGIDAPQMAMAC